MEKIRLGKTGLMVTRSGFGALPIQRCPPQEAVSLLRGAYEGGINFYDTARSYSDSEEKLGMAFDAGMRKNIIIATKSPATTRQGVLDDVAVSLSKLKTDYIDILQLHNPAQLPDRDDAQSSYAALAQLKRSGVVRFIGLTQHRLDYARQALHDQAYDTLQFPLSSLSSDEDIAFIHECAAADMALIAMKALSGGLITNAATSFAFLRQFENVVPIWGIQQRWELDNILQLEACPPALDDDMWAQIHRDRQDLMGSFCRGCGYCLPCPVDIPINMAARMSLLLRRSPYRTYMSDDWAEKMQRIDSCLHCGHCSDHCPYHLDTPALLQTMLADYREFYALHHAD
ncbi:MAG: aldo/keto reductase [Eubacteriales bacterium]|nr:aldo/keto reductase [Eubacteriales bacterium]